MMAAVRLVTSSDAVSVAAGETAFLAAAVRSGMDDLKGVSANFPYKIQPRRVTAAVPHGLPICPYL